MMQGSVHSTAIIEEGVVLGEKVEVGPFAYVAAGAKIGAGCRIGPHTAIYGCVTMGSGCQVHAGVVLGDLPQDTAFSGEDSYVEIGNDCIFREGVTVHRGTKPGTFTRIGSRCMFMANSHVAHNSQIADEVIMANGALLGGYVELGRRVFISGNVGVHQFVRIGDMAMLGVGCAVTMDVPPYCTVRPASVNCIMGLNIVGMRRAGLQASDRAAIKQAFKEIYLRGKGASAAVELLRADDALQSDPVRLLIDFVASSERGICSYTRS